MVLKSTNAQGSPHVMMLISITQKGPPRDVMILSTNGNLFRVTAKLRNIITNPLQRLQLVIDAIITRNTIAVVSRQLRVCEESEDAKSVVDGHNNALIVAANVWKNNEQNKKIWIFRQDCISLHLFSHPNTHDFSIHTQDFRPLDDA